jgi:DNA-nicking Smr family endonuclease
MTKRGQGDDDFSLWARVAATASPLQKRKAAASVRRAPAAPTMAAPTAAGAPRAAPVVNTPSAKPVAKPAAPLDRQTSRHLDKGKIAVEARLDLHGMRQADAHTRLRQFLKSAQARGVKHVLVITGKGAEANAKSFYEEDERGVLRKAVPHWLSSNELAPLVVSFSSAPRRLGGEGALYVRVRRSRPA